MKRARIIKNIFAVLPKAALTTVIIFFSVSSSKAETPAEAKEKLIAQCIKQMTETEADGAGKAMAFQMLQKLGSDAKSAVPALTKALDHEDNYIRTQSAYTLWKVDRQTKAIISLGKIAETDKNMEVRAAAAKLLKEIDQQLAEELAAQIDDKKKQVADAEVVAKGFITALANKNVNEAVKYVIPKERDEFNEALKNGIPPLPKDPKIQIKIKDDGIQADVSLLNTQKPASGPPFGFDMKFSEGEWWIAK